MSAPKFGDVAWRTWASLENDLGPRDSNGFTVPMDQADRLAMAAFPNCEDEPWWGTSPMWQWWPDVEFGFVAGECAMVRLVEAPTPAAPA